MNLIEKYFNEDEFQDDEVMINEYPYQNASAAAPPMWVNQQKFKWKKKNLHETF